MSSRRGSIRRGSVLEVQVLLETKKRETQLVMRQAEQQRQRWETQDKIFATWNVEQKRKVSVIDEMLNDIPNTLGRHLSDNEKSNLRNMKNEILYDIDLRNLEHTTTRNNEQHIELTSEQRCILYGVDAAKREKKEKSKQTQHPANDHKVIKPPVRRQSEVHGKQPSVDEAEVKKSASNKMTAIYKETVRMKDEDQTRKNYVSQRRIKANDLKSKLQLAERQQDEDTILNISEQLETIDSQIRMRELEFEEEKKWTDSQRPQFTDDERRYLRGLESSKKARRGSTYAAKLDRMDLKVVLDEKGSAGQLPSLIRSPTVVSFKVESLTNNAAFGPIVNSPLSSPIDEGFTLPSIPPLLPSIPPLL